MLVNKQQVTESSNLVYKLSMRNVTRGGQEAKGPSYEASQSSGTKCAIAKRLTTNGEIKKLKSSHRHEVNISLSAYVCYRCL